LCEFGPWLFTRRKNSNWKLPTPLETLIAGEVKLATFTRLPKGPM